MKIYKRHRQSGQILLMIILMSTIVATIGLSVLHSSTEDTRMAALEEDAKNAYAAAEAGIEAVLETNSNDLTDLSFDGITITADIQDQPTGIFTTPLIPKDGQYTFYFASYDELTNQINGDTYAGDVTVSLSDLTPKDCGEMSEQFAVELTFFDFTDESESVYRRLIDLCDMFEGTYHEWGFGDEKTLSSESPAIAGHVMIMRVIAPSISFEGVKLTIDDDSGTSQGKVIISTATTTTGVVKKIKLFKSFPQLPADFFVTSF
jgi:hypothetical protein